MNDIIQLIIFTIAGILHGITGMGFPMIGTSALSFSLPLSQAVAIVAIPSLLMSLLVLCSNNKQGIWRELTDYLHQYKLLAITSVIGGIIGVKLLLILPVAYLCRKMRSRFPMQPKPEYLCCFLPRQKHPERYLPNFPALP